MPSQRRFPLSILIIVALALILTNGSFGHAQDTVTTVTLASITVGVGETGTVEGIIECAADGCSAFAIAIRFDPAFLRVERIAVGPYLGAQVFVVENVIDNDAGIARLAATVLGAWVPTQETVLFQLDVTGLQVSVTAISIVELEVGDAVGNPVTAQGISGAVVINAAVLPTPAPTAASAPTPAPTRAPMTGRTPLPVDTPVPASATPTPTFVAALLPALDSTPIPENAETNWTPIMREINGLVMVYVPGGCFSQSWSDDTGDHSATPCVEPFWIGLTEVTNAQYRRCVDVGVCDPPTDRRYYGNPAYDDHPVVYVTRAQAAAFAAWWGGDLPTEAQWIFANGGPESSSYPWGTGEITCEKANYEGCVGGTAPVGPDQRPAGASWVGALDMRGNVHEWVIDPFMFCAEGADCYNPKGGSWNTEANVTGRILGQDESDPEFGFRVIASP
jgi:formylglycine-generating enzyme required for sulfatase activity